VCASCSTLIATSVVAATGKAGPFSAKASKTRNRVFIPHDSETISTAWLVAVTVTLRGDGTAFGAWYKPPLAMVA
jgi:hypothetical protein